MRVCVSAFVLPSGPGATKAGVGRFIVATLDGIARTDLGHEYDVFLPDRFALPPEWEQSPWVRWHPVPVPNARSRAVWEHARVAVEARRRGADVLFCPFPAVPLRSRVSVVPVIFDAFPRTHPQWFTPRKRRVMDGLHALAARRSTRIVTISEWCRGEIARAYRVSPAKISVTVCGPGNRLNRLPPDELARVDVSTVVPHGVRYIMTLSTLEPRKNLPGLLEAFARLRPEQPGLKLLVVGARGWQETPVFDAVGRQGLQDDVIFAGYVDDAMIGPLLQRAELVVVPSYVEGFGIPALEAMLVGAPVACSNTSSLPEVVGEAAFGFPPEDPARMAEVLSAALSDPGARIAMGRAGAARAARFTWDASLRGIERAWIEAASGPTSGRQTVS